MSWSASTTLMYKRDAEGLEVNVSVLNNLVASGQDYAAKERDEQLEIAKSAAHLILGSGMFDNADEVGVSMSGHANEGHNDVKGANESILVNVFVKKYRSPEQS